MEGENSVDMQIIKYILASRTFLLQKNYTIAYKVLDKAEYLATEHSLFPILNEIYHTKIQYAPEFKKVDINELITKQIENQHKHRQEDQLNIAYAKLKLVLKEINHQGKVIDFETILSETLKDTGIEINKSLSFKSLYQILAIANFSALATTAYYSIEGFVLKAYNILKNKKDSNKQVFYQIHIVYIIANTLFRNKKFEASLIYLNEMEELMLQNNKLYYKNFVLKHTLVKALNLNFNNDYKAAISLTNKCISKKHSDIETMLELNLSLAMMYFQQNDFIKVKSIFSQFYHTDKWYIKKVGIDWVIKKNLMEILLYIELGEENLLTSRVNSFKRSYTSYLKDIKQQRILRFLSFIEAYYKNSNTINPNMLMDKVDKTFISSKNTNEDIFVISFYAWLKSKLSKTPLYKTTLDIIKIT